MRNRAWLALLVLFASTSAAFAENGQTRDTYGEVGLLDMPSAHMVDDGHLALTVGTIEHTQRFTLSFQALPWLETAFRYSHVAPGSQLYDRSFSFKARLLSETESFADVAVGVRDLLGTGIYSSEYLTASKHLGPFDLTAGLGWGRMSDTGELPNPLGAVISSFKERGGTASATGGAVNLGQFFHGSRVGIFGGVAWETPLEGLSVLAEYSSDKYSREKLESSKTFVVRSPVNLGLSYQLADSVSLGAGWYYGSTYGVTLAFGGDLKSETPSAGRLGPPIPEPHIRTDAQQMQALARISGRQDWPVADRNERLQMDARQTLLGIGNGVRDVDLQGATLIVDARHVGDIHAQCASYANIIAGVGGGIQTIALSDLQSSSGYVAFCKTAPAAAPRPQNQERVLRAALREQDLGLDAVAASGGELWIYYSNGRYRDENQAAGRVIRVLMKNADPSIEVFHLFPLSFGRPSQEIRVARGAMERIATSSGTVDEAGSAISLAAAPLNNPILDQSVASAYPKFFWAVNPILSQQFFDPDRPLGLGVIAEASAGLILLPGLTLGTDLTFRLWDNFNLSRPPDSLLPHVRTDILQYLSKGANGISYLSMDYQTRVSPEVFVDFKAGYLEDMFAGVGAQILWRPQGSRFAIGVDGYQVWKRNFDRLFGLQDYQVFTGHASIYYESPWYGMNFSLHAGRYLARDRGVTFEIKRRFATGVEVGAYATFTNVPFSTFGEGSFDKGIYLHIPLQWALPVFTQSAYNMNLRSLTRDGGQRLAGDDSLYYVTRSDSYNDINARLQDLVSP